jgi:hypothetical protein
MLSEVFIENTCSITYEFEKAFTIIPINITRV